MARFSTKEIALMVSLTSLIILLGGANFALAERDCLTARTTPGCSLSACEDKVCGKLSFCCTNEWNSTCVLEAQYRGTICEVEPTPTLPGNCCSTSSAPGCSKSACQSCVCGMDSYCCNNSWDSTCVSKAQDQCFFVCTCAAATTCVPGERKTTSCGNCGTKSKTCRTDGKWPTSWGNCRNEGVCAAGATNSAVCACPSDTCSGATRYDYPVYGDCTGTCGCNTSTSSGGGCAPTTTANSPACDTVAPTATFTPSSTAWGNTVASPIVNFTDNISGVDQARYCWTIGTACEPSTTFANNTALTQTTAGQWYLCASATDKAGNKSQAQCSGPYNVGFCSAGSTKTCASSQGCSHILTCQSNYTWPACPSDACAAGSTTSTACGNCGSQAKTCTSACQWPAAYGVCSGEGECSVGSINLTPCGNCGTKSRTCSSACAWNNYGACTGEGACSAGSTTSTACGNCGSQAKTCTSACQWPAAYGVCSGEGVCPANQQDSSVCACPVDTCSGATRYDYPIYGDCTGSCSCSTSTSLGGGCAPTTTANSPACDTVAPTATFTPSSTAWGSNTASPIVNFTDNISGVASARYCWTIGTACEPSTTFANNTALTQTTAGQWYLCASATDKAGNKSANQCSGPYNVGFCSAGSTKTCASSQGCSHILTCQSNYTWPACPSDTCSAGSVTSTACACGQTNKCDGATYYEYPTYSACSSSCSCSTSTSLGGGCAPTTTANSPKCDSVLPIVNITSHNNSFISGTVYYSNTGNITISGTASDMGSGLKNVVWNSDGAYETGTYGLATPGAAWSYAWTNLPEGKSYIYIAANDNAGNFSGWNANVTVLVDKTSPSMSVVGAPASWQNSNGSASVACSDTRSGCDAATYKLKTYASAVPCSANYADYTLTGSQSIIGHQWVCSAAKDKAGNIGFSATAQAFKVDKTPPQGTVSFTTSSVGGGISLNITAIGADSESGIASLQLYCDKNLAPTCSGISTVYSSCPTGSGSCSYTWPAIPDYHFYGSPAKADVQVKDKAGNTTMWSSPSMDCPGGGVCCISGAKAPASTVCNTSIEYKCGSSSTSTCGDSIQQTTVTRYCNGSETSTCSGVKKGGVGDAFAVWTQASKCSSMEYCVATIVPSQVPACQFNVVCDKAAPKITVSGGPASGAWLKEGGAASFTIQDKDMPEGKDGDDNSGLNTTTCGWSSTAVAAKPRTCNAAVNIAVGKNVADSACKTEGPSACNINFYALDKANNYGSASKTFNTDFTAPGIEWEIYEGTLGGWHGGTFNPFIKYFDKDANGDSAKSSGLKKCYYQIYYWDFGPEITPVFTNYVVSIVESLPGISSIIDFIRPYIPYAELIASYGSASAKWKEANSPQAVECDGSKEKLARVEMSISQCKTEGSGVCRLVAWVEDATGNTNYDTVSQIDADGTHKGKKIDFDIDRTAPAVWFDSPYNQSWQTIGIKSAGAFIYDIRSKDCATHLPVEVIRSYAKILSYQGIAAALKGAIWQPSQLANLVPWSLDSWKQIGSQITDTRAILTRLATALNPIDQEFAKHCGDFIATAKDCYAIPWGDDFECPSVGSTQPGLKEISFEVGPAVGAYCNTQGKGHCVLFVSAGDEASDKTGESALSLNIDWGAPKSIFTSPAPIENEYMLAPSFSISLKEFDTLADAWPTPNQSESSGIIKYYKQIYNWNYIENKWVSLTNQPIERYIDPTEANAERNSNETVTINSSGDCRVGSKHLGDKTCKVEFWAEDRAGNKGIKIAREFSITPLPGSDIVPPTAKIVAPGNFWQADDFAIKLEYNDTGDSFCDALNLKQDFRLAECSYRVLSANEDLSALYNSRPGDFNTKLNAVSSLSAGDCGKLLDIGGVKQCRLYPVELSPTITVGPEVTNLCLYQGANRCVIEVSAKDWSGNKSQTPLPERMRFYSIDWEKPTVALKATASGACASKDPLTEWVNCTSSAAISSCVDSPSTTNSGCNPATQKLYLPNSSLWCPNLQPYENYYGAFGVPSLNNITAPVLVCGAAKDNAGNMGSTPGSTQLVKVDTEKPSCSLTLSKVCAKAGAPVSINIQGRDNIFVKQLSYTINDTGEGGQKTEPYLCPGAPVWPFTPATCLWASSVTPLSSEYKINGLVKDIANTDGNKCLAEDIVLKIDANAPTTGIEFVGNGTGGAWVNGASIPEFILKCEDKQGVGECAGCKSTWWAEIDSAQTKEESEGKPITEADKNIIKAKCANLSLVWHSGLKDKPTCPNNAGCQKKICFYSIDNFDHKAIIGDEVSKTFKIDKKSPTAPVLALTPASALTAPTFNGSQWLSIGVSLTAQGESDEHSGISKRYFSVRDAFRGVTTAGERASNGGFNITVGGVGMCQSEGKDKCLVYAFSKDMVNNESAYTLKTFSVDIANPVVKRFVSTGNMVNVANPTITFNWEVEDTGAGLKQVELWQRKAGGGWTRVGQPKTISGALTTGVFTDSPQANGVNYEYGLHVLDNLDKLGQEPVILAVYVDTVAPTVPPVLSPAPGNYPATVTVSIAPPLNEAGDGLIRYTIGGSSPLESSSVYKKTEPFTFNAPAGSEITHSIMAAYWDKGDNRGPDATGVYNVGWPAAMPTVTPGQGTCVKDTGALFNFSSPTPLALYQCKIDNTDWSICVAPKKYLDLAAGQHSFSVKAKNKYGDSAPSALYSWNIDNIKPVINSFSVNPVQVKQGSTAVSWSVSDTGGCGLKQTEIWRRLVGSTTWENGNINTSALSSGVFYDSPSQDGLYEYGLHAVDTAENLATEGKTIQVLFDRTAPAASMIAPPEHSLQAPDKFSPSLQAIFSDNLGLKECWYKVESRANIQSSWYPTLEWASIAGCLGKTLIGLSQDISVGEAGTNCPDLGTDVCRVTVKTIDALGNESSGTPRLFSISASPDVATPVTTIQCKATTDIAPTTCRTNWYNKNDGDVAIALQCADTVGRAPSGCKESFWCQGINCDPATPYLPANLPKLTNEGENIIRAYSSDIAGNPLNTEVKAAAIAVQTIKLDKISPLVKVEGALQEWSIVDANASVSCLDATSGCDTNTFKYKIYDGVKPVACPASQYEYLPYSVGLPVKIGSHYWVCAAAKDKAGNIGLSEPTEFRIDKIEPRVSNVSGGFNVSPISLNIKNNSSIIVWQVNDTGGSGLKQIEVWRALDANNDGVLQATEWLMTSLVYKGPFDTENSDKGDLQDIPPCAKGKDKCVFWYGLHILDKANNVGTESKSLFYPIKVVVDPTPPPKPVCVATPNLIAKSVTISCSDSELNTVISYTKSDIEPFSAQPPDEKSYIYSFPLTYNTKTRVTAAAWDAAGNRSEEPDNSYLMEILTCPPLDTFIDKTPPTTIVNINSVPTNATNLKNASFEFHGTASPVPNSTTKYECSLDDSGWSECSSPKTYDNLADWFHTFKSRAIDVCGNIDQTPVENKWFVDSSFPRINQFVSDRSCLNIANPKATISWGLVDQGAGLREAELWRRELGGTWQISQTKEISGASFSGVFQDDFSGKLVEKTYQYGIHVEDMLGNNCSETDCPSAPGIMTIQVDTKPPAPPVCSPSSGEYSDPIQVACSAELGQDIRYSTTTAPNSASPLYQIPLTFSKDTILKAITWDKACDPFDNVSSAASYDYRFVDIKKPEILVFNVLPRLLNADSLSLPTILWTVKDIGGSHLKQVEISRAPYKVDGCLETNQTKCVWQGIGGPIPAPVNSDNWSSALIDNALTNGDWWYGLTVWDNSSNTAKAAPIKVEKDAIPPTIAIPLTLKEGWYNTNPKLDGIKFTDDRALLDGFYQVEGDSANWLTIFSGLNNKETTTTDFTIQNPLWDSFIDGSSRLVYFKASDKAGNITGKNKDISLILKKDISSPTTTIQIDGAKADKDNSWYVGDVNIAMHCSDKFSGCASIVYCKNDPSKPDEYCSNVVITPGDKSSLKLDQSGLYEITYYSIDRAGNTEKPRGQLIRLDKEKPAVTAFDMKAVAQVDDIDGLKLVARTDDPYSINMPYPIAAVSWQAGDTGASHLKQIELWRAAWDQTNCGQNSMNNCLWQRAPLGTGDFIYPAFDLDNYDVWSNLANPMAYIASCSGALDGCVFWYYLRVSDWAGNVADSVPLKLLVDRVAPSVVIESPKNGVNLGNFTSMPKVDLSAEFKDRALGLNSCEYAFYDLSTEIENLDDLSWESMGGCFSKDYSRLNQQALTNKKDCLCTATGLEATEACYCILFFKAEDIGGNIALANTSFSFITSPAIALPSTFIKCNGEQCKTDWYNKNTNAVNISFECAPGANCAKTYWCSGAANCSPTKTGPLPLAQDGIYYINFYSENSAGVKETVKSQLVRIDKTSPVVGAPGGAPVDWTNQAATATFTACEDTLSGCNPDSYGLLLVPTDDYDSRQIFGRSLLVDLTANLYALASDYAGNQKTSWPGVLFKVDTTPPGAQIDSPAAHTWFKNNFAVEVWDSDSGSGVDSTQCRYSIFDTVKQINVKERQTRVCNTDFNVTVGAQGECASEGKDTCRVSIINKDKVGLSSAVEAGVNVRAYSIDYTAPAVGKTSPLVAATYSPQTFTALVSDKVAVAWCDLYVDNVNQGAMTLSVPLDCKNCSASKIYTFSLSGNHQMFVRCGDLSDNLASGEAVTVNVRLTPNNPPSVVSLKIEPGDYCVFPLRPIFSWTFQDVGDRQSAYRVVVDNNADFSSPVIDTGRVLSPSVSYAHNDSRDLAYNTTYYWRVMVWDSKDASSQWSLGPAFVTPKHAYPQVNFDWSPARPLVDQAIQFSDKTVYSAAAVAWQWNFGDNTMSLAQNPQHAYSRPNLYPIMLIVYDTDNYSCSLMKSDDAGVRIFLDLPEWQEIPPF